jgi:hypothetical protein
MITAMFRVASVTLLLILVCSCVLAQPLASQKSPNGRIEVVVSEWRPFFDSKITISLNQGSSRKVVLTENREMNPALVQIVWQKDSNIFGVLVTTNGPNLLFAYDTKNDRPVEPALIMDDLRSALIERYGLQEQARIQPSFDPIDWIAKQMDEGKIPRIH